MIRTCQTTSTTTTSDRDPRTAHHSSRITTSARPAPLPPTESDLVNRKRADVIRSTHYGVWRAAARFSFCLSTVVSSLVTWCPLVACLRDRCCDRCCNRQTCAPPQTHGPRAEGRPQAIPVLRRDRPAAMRPVWVRRRTGRPDPGWGAPASATRRATQASSSKWTCHPCARIGRLRGSHARALRAALEFDGAGQCEA